MGITISLHYTILYIPHSTESVIENSLDVKFLIMA